MKFEGEHLLAGQIGHLFVLLGFVAAILSTIAYFTASTDKADLNKKFAESLKVDYPILSDPEGKTATALGVFNADKKFANRYTVYIGKDGKILFIDKKVTAASHGTDVAAKLKELGVAKK